MPARRGKAVDAGAGDRWVARLLARSASNRISRASDLWNNGAGHLLTARMIAITLTAAAFEALKGMQAMAEATQPGADGLIRVWLDHRFIDRLARMRASPESYSDVILRLARS